MAGIYTQALNSLAQRLKSGEKVQRLIDTLWFDAVIVGISKDRQSVNLRYLDDDNIEDHVPIEEIRLYVRHNEEHENIGRAEKNTLPRPLAGIKPRPHPICISTLFILLLHRGRPSGG